MELGLFSPRADFTSWLHSTLDELPEVSEIEKLEWREVVYRLPATHRSSASQLGTVDQIGPADQLFLVRRTGPLSFNEGAASWSTARRLPRGSGVPPQYARTASAQRQSASLLRTVVQVDPAVQHVLDRRAGTLFLNRGAASWTTARRLASRPRRAASETVRRRPHRVQGHCPCPSGTRPLGCRRVGRRCRPWS